MENLSLEETQIDIDKKHLAQLRRRVSLLKKRNQPEQRSPEWYLQRQKKITASEAASCIVASEKNCKEYISQFNVTDFKFSETRCCNPYQTKDAYIIKKCQDFFSENGGNYKDNIYTLWGKKYEQIANRVYTIFKNTKVFEFGLISHNKIHWLAASPDGITNDGVMLEIKCPKSRKIGTAPPIYYWIQVQIQLEVCNLDVCDFLECDITEFASEEEYVNYELQENQDKGIIIDVIDPVNPYSTPVYVYPPEEYMTPQQFEQWAENKEKELKATDPNCITKRSYFLIKNFSIIPIPRSKIWFESVSAEMKSTWDQVMLFQDNKELFEQHLELKKKNKPEIPSPEPLGCLIEDDD